jgi:hypothetical protein
MMQIHNFFRGVFKISWNIIRNVTFAQKSNKIFAFLVEIGPLDIRRSSLISEDKVLHCTGGCSVWRRRRREFQSCTVVNSVVILVIHEGLYRSQIIQSHLGSGGELRRTVFACS